MYSAWFQALLFASFNALWTISLLWAVERLWLRGRKPSASENVRALKFMAVSLIVGGICVGTFEYYRPAPLIDLKAVMHDAMPAWLFYPLGAFVMAALYDFFNYWMHRAQHKWFWNQHRVHHSITNLTALNAYFHPTEYLFRIFLIYIPLSSLFGWGMAVFGLAISMLNTLQGAYVHSPTSAHYGFMRCLFVDNRFHRVHHSIEQRHFDKNFGAFTTIWDRLFGTAYWPAKDEWPETGVHDFREVETVREYLAAPFRQDRGKAAVGTVYPLSDA